MDSKKIIKDAWNIAIKNKKLIWFGLLASITLLVNISYSVVAFVTPEGLMAELGATGPSQTLRFTFLSIISERGVTYPTWIIILSLILNLFLILISSFHSPAIINGLLMIRDGENPEFRCILSRTVRKILPIFLFTLITATIGSFRLVFDQYVRLQQNFLFNVSFCGVNTVLTIVVGLFTLFVPMVIIVDDLDLIPALIHTWKRIIKPHFGRAIGISIVIGLIILAMMLVTWLPPFLVANLILKLGQFKNIFSLLLVLLILIPIPTVGYGFSYTFYNAALLGFYDQIKAIDRVKEAAIEFDGEVEMDVEEENLFAPSDDLPSSE